MPRNAGGEIDKAAGHQTLKDAMQKHLEFIFVGNMEVLMILKGDMIKNVFKKDHLATEERQKRQWGKTSFQRC